MTETQTEFVPVAQEQRIHALDIVRGFALLGIALMNVEFFNRPLAALDDGLPTGLTGMDAWAGWLIHVFVRAKFFTMFSILFGMGFAVMLARAQAAGREFTGAYLRRTLALALFGLAHGVLIWAGDILLSYAGAALLLLIVLFARGWAMWLAFALMVVVSFAIDPGNGGFTAMILLLDGVVLALLRRGQRIEDAPTVASQSLRGRRLLGAGLALYLIPSLMMVAAGGMMTVAAGAHQDESVAAESGKPAAQQADTQKQAVAKARAERAAHRAEETRVMTRGSYAEAVAFRAKQFTGDYLKALFFLTVALGLFLIGAWLLQSGAMRDPAAHLPLFRRMAFVVLPLGLMATLAGAAIAVRPDPAKQGEWLLSMGLMFTGGMPMSLGYIALVMLALQRDAWRRLLGWLAPMGQMALTNYIGQSVLGTLFFYGYGLGHWALPRAQQVVYVLVVFALQLVFSKLWLLRFRYGPLEWLWRAATYRQWPLLRRSTVR
ncbi:DUF418 domain-containing protein [Pseudoxanthomonas helianthi]|uniref:DUF418 domain-containing protein n=1 Tax=Pseudoxanthomonas helianthi TaxID=1453541 RepID=A0A940X4E8_9GAMM|nr:DUF418 domain-containing protein [Pseudoxanthomonas helianthi]MBP3984836.1 DUF418 domain-containing protein [Pseudoxanthomonas helianthi]